MCIRDRYLVGLEYKDGSYVTNANPCAMCKRLIINAGIEKVVVRDTATTYRLIDVYDNQSFAHRTGAVSYTHLEKALDAAGIRAVVQDRPGTGTLVVQANEIADSNLSLDEAKQAFYSLMPAHLEAEFVTGGLDFSQCEQLGKSWAQLDALDKSWSQLEMMGLQQWKEKEEEGQDVQQQ